MRGCCGRARSWASSWCTASPAGPRGGGESNWSSTHSTSPCCRCGPAAGTPGSRPRTTSPGTPTPRPVPSPCPATTSPARPASTPSPCSGTSTTGRPPAGSTTLPSPALRPPPRTTPASSRTGKVIPVDDFRQMISYDELTSDGTITLARIAAEAIRGLNWTTNCDAGLDQPSAAYDVLGALSQAAARLGQLLTQITRYLDQALAAAKRPPHR